MVTYLVLVLGKAITSKIEIVFTSANLDLKFEVVQLKGEQAEAELCQAQRCLSCQLAWVAYSVLNQLWLELVAWLSSRLEFAGWRRVTKCRIRLCSATWEQATH